MDKFPVEAPKAKALRALGRLGFRVVRAREHVAMIRDNPDGTKTPLTMPKHRRVKGVTPRRICTQAGIRREDFLKAYEEA